MDSATKGFIGAVVGLVLAGVTWAMASSFGVGLLAFALGFGLTLALLPRR